MAGRFWSACPPPWIAGAALRISEQPFAPSVRMAAWPISSLLAAAFNSAVQSRFCDLGLIHPFEVGGSQPPRLIAARGPSKVRGGFFQMETSYADHGSWDVRNRRSHHA